MAEEFLQGGVCWWNSPRNLFSSSPCSLASNDIIGSFGWPTHDLIASVRSTDESTASDGTKSTLHMIGVGPSSAAAPDGWNRDLLSDSGTSEENYSDFLLDSSMNYRPQMNKDWNSNSKNFSQDSSINSLNQSFGGEQQQQQQPPMNSVSSSAECVSAGINPSAGSDSYSSLLQTLFDTDSQPQQSLLDHHQTPMSYSSSAAIANYQLINSNGFLPNLHMAKQQPFANRVWISTAASFSNVRPTFLPSPPSQFLPSSLTNHKLNNIHSIGDHKQQEQGKDLATVMKKASNEPAFKRPRIETPSPLPTFKVRKEKLGDRITALQQLVSPFGKTDTASVLHEAIEYIRFLHDQVNALSTPYLKYGSPPVQRQQGTEKSKDEEGLTKDLKTRGLCLVPISSTFPVAAETTTDFWTPTFGGSFR